MAAIGHLARRFVGSLRPGGPGADAERWVQSVLPPPLFELWAEMPGPDRRHSYGVARAVQQRLAEQATPPVLAAALLHDVGKLSSGLRTPGRVLATLIAAAQGRTAAEQWSTRRGLPGRIGRYLRHPEMGAVMLERAGADPFTVAWAAQHHRPATEWSVDVELATVLNEVDDD